MSLGHPNLFDLARADLGDEVAGTDEHLNEAWLAVKEPESFEENEPLELTEWEPKAAWMGSDNG